MVWYKIGNINDIFLVDPNYYGGGHSFVVNNNQDNQDTAIDEN